MPMTAALDNGQCSKHSGVCEAINDLKDAKRDQDSINIRIFNRLDEINSKLAWILGGVTVVGVLLTLFLGVLALYKH